MILKRLFRRIFRKKTGKTYVLDVSELSKHRTVRNLPGFYRDDDKSIFEIKDSFEINERGTVIYGRVKRGFFKVGDIISICNPTDTNEKLSAAIIKIITPLVESNRIECGLEAEIMTDICGNKGDIILPGDRAYKKCKTGGIKNAIQ